MSNLRDSIGLYIHIPFCIKKCFYCDFNSIPVSENTKNRKLIKRYMNALYMEIEKYAGFSEKGNYQVKSIFFGGGTPSLVSADEIGETLKSCKRVFKILEDAEITIEANPGTVNADSLRNYLRLGINRISFGCQSFQDEELKKIGRIHRAEDIFKSFEMAREIGFDNLSVDLIFGIPGQGMESFYSSLKRAVSLKPEHISLYNLTIEEGTQFYQQIKAGEFELLEEDVQIEMYEHGIQILKKNNFEHYEISNFALKGKRCRHNENYWRGGEYLGFGAGAHSFIRIQHSSFIVQRKDVAAERSSALLKQAGKQIPPNPLLLKKVWGASKEQGKGEPITLPTGSRVIGKRWWNVKDVREYCRANEKSHQPSAISHQEKSAAAGFSLRKKLWSVVDEEEMLSEDKHMAEVIMLGLRMIEGINTKEVFNNYGVSIEEKYKREIEGLKKDELIELKNGRLRLTHKGILFSNEVFLKFIH